MAKVGEGGLQIDDGRVDTLEIFTKAPAFRRHHAFDPFSPRELMLKAENLPMRWELMRELTRV